MTEIIGVEKNKETPRKRYIEDREYAAIRELAPPAVQIAMDVSYLTGLRLGDILNIRIDDYDQEFLAIREGKTSTKVRFEMIDTLFAALEAHKQLPGRPKDSTWCGPVKAVNTCHPSMTICHPLASHKDHFFPKRD